jgi:peptidoglycan hydrolase-like protein with peptidoglycan-binding domain
MARTTDMPAGMFPVWIYDVTHPVGYKWFQYRDDVLLVQYALNKIIAKGKILDRNGKPTPGPMGPEYPPLAALKVDGIFGPKTHAAVVTYQKGGSVLADGEVDPVYEQIGKLKGDPISPRYLSAYTSLPKFTMVRLNKDILDLYGSMMDDADFPKEVQAALRHQPVQAG